MFMLLPKNNFLAFTAVSIVIGSRVGLAANLADSDTPASAPAAQAAAPQLAAEARPSRTLNLTVVSKVDGSALLGATVWVRNLGGRVHSWEGRTDDDGHYAVVPPSEATHGFDISVASAGFALGGVRSATGVTNHILELEPTEPIGGTVRDQHGRPIEGARVLATVYPFVIIWPEIYVSPNSELAIAKTDAHGRWRSDALPVKTRPETRVRVLVTHPDHIMGEFSTTVAKSRALASEQVMDSGLSVSGTVFSPFGRPVPGATVVVGMRPWAGFRSWEGMYLRLLTDRNGQFHTGRCIDPSQSKTLLTVQASGLALAAREIPAVPETSPQVIRLTRRRPIEGRVVDAEGRPVEGAVVASSVYAFNGLLGWDTETDGNGRFVWFEAPTDVTILLSVFKPPFQPVRGRAVDPGSREFTITLDNP
jgi:hypothetical protein